MEEPRNVKLRAEDVLEVFQQSMEPSLGLRLELDPKKHLLNAYNNEMKRVWDLRFPLPFPQIPPESTPESYYTLLIQRKLSNQALLLPSLIALVQVGAAALAYTEGENIVEHKAIKKYMKRHGQGRAQIHYLNTRGKSKAGSRVRLANTVSFLEEINERLTLWHKTYLPQRILYSCGEQLWGMLFQSSPPPPFDKKDERLIKIPRDTDIPDFEELQRNHRFAIHGWKRSYE